MPQTVVIRAAIGLAQGLALFLLYTAYDAKAWPASDGSVFAALLLASVFAPLVLVAGLNNLRLRTLAIWAVIVLVLCVGLGFYDIVRAPVSRFGESRIVPSELLCLALLAGLFITHALIASGDADRAYVASYARYFDVTWKLGIQAVLAAAFVGVFWGLLWLGAELFRLIRVEALYDLIKKPWFGIPATTLVLTYAINVTDVHASVVRGARTLGLTLLSWLLPLMTLIAVAFLLTLPFTGLEPLWSMRRATAVMLTAAATLIVLINAVYQDGRFEGQVSRVLRYVSVVGAVALVPLVGLAAYGLTLRVQQYGWTPERIVALACIVVAACYAAGYALAAVRSGAAMRWLATTNVFTAFVVLAILLALFTPLADPARISVASQVGRLEAGRVAPDRFDFNFLRFRSGRYGTEALERLAARTEGVEAAAIAERAKQALRRTSLAGGAPATPQTRATNIAVIHPAGQALPDSFLQQDWNADPARWRAPCLMRDIGCEAILLDLDGDGELEILLLGSPSGAAVFKTDGKRWSLVGGLANVHCPGVREALRAGRFETVPPLMKDIEANGQRLHIGAAPACAPAKPAP